MMKHMNTQKGFTLIEIAVVFVILAALLAASIYPLTAQRESAHIAEAKIKLKEIQEALYGFAIAQDRIPCPTLPNNGGASVPLNPVTPATGPPDNCQSYHGFVPSTTLGISGSVNCDGLLLDPWGQPYRYSVTSTDDPVNGNPGYADFVVSDETSQVQIINLDPVIMTGPNQYLRVCRNLGVGCPASAPIDIVSDYAVAVIYSLGKPRSTSNAQEDQNAGEAAPLASSCGIASYEMPNDRFFYSAERREIVGQEFDDIMIWISPNILYSRLLQAGQLP